MRLSGTVLKVRQQAAGADYPAYQKAFVLDVESDTPTVRTCRVGDQFGLVVEGEVLENALVNVGVWEGRLTCALVARGPLAGILPVKRD